MKSKENIDILLALKILIDSRNTYSAFHYIEQAAINYGLDIGQIDDLLRAAIVMCIKDANAEGLSDAEEFKSLFPDRDWDFNYTPETSKEIWRRSMVALAAYTYEIGEVEIMSDETFDRLCSEIDLSITTNRPDLDKWFKKHFSPNTGQWIHKHPDLPRIRNMFYIMKRYGRIPYVE